MTTNILPFQPSNSSETIKNAVFALVLQKAQQHRFSNIAAESVITASMANSLVDCVLASGLDTATSGDLLRDHFKVTGDIIATSKSPLYDDFDFDPSAVATEVIGLVQAAQYKVEAVEQVG